MSRRLERLRLALCGGLSGAVVLFWLVLALLAALGLVLDVGAFVGETVLRFLLLGALATGGLLGCYAMLRYGSRREPADDLAGVCQAMHLCYHPVVPRESLGTLTTRPPLDRLWKRQTPGRNRVEGKIGQVEFLLLDCPARSGYQTLAIFPGTNAGLPSFRLRPRTTWDRLLGIEGLDFDQTGLPERDQQAVARFRNDYVLEASGAHEQAIRRVFTADVVAFFAQNAGWSLHSEEGLLVVWQRLVDTARTAELHLGEQVLHLSPRGEAARRLDLLGKAQAIRRLITMPGPPNRVLALNTGQGLRLRPLLTAIFHGVLIGAWLGVCIGFFLALDLGPGRAVQGASRGLLAGAGAGGLACALLAFTIQAHRSRRTPANTRQPIDVLPPS
jgi:hypothetical protein